MFHDVGLQSQCLLLEEDIGRVAVKAYSNANKNPYAHMRTAKMSFEAAASSSDRNPCFLANEELNPYMKMSDCSQVSDGAAAILLVSEVNFLLNWHNFSIKDLAN